MSHLALEVLDDTTKTNWTAHSYIVGIPETAGQGVHVAVRNLCGDEGYKPLGSREKGGQNLAGRSTRQRSMGETT